MKDMTYAKHGIKKPLGLLATINGKRAVAYVGNNNQITSYTTMDEINDLFHEKDADIPKYQLDF